MLSSHRPQQLPFVFLLSALMGAVGVSGAFAQTVTLQIVAGQAKVNAPVPPEDIPLAPAGVPPAPSGATAGMGSDAALALANTLDGAAGGVSSADLLAALQDAAAAGQPVALWRLGVMYENGEGVQKDDVKAFQYFSRIANDHADAPPRSLEADVVAQSFVKMGEYYEEGLPDAGIKADVTHAQALLLHAASYFGDAEAQYRVGELYLQKDGLDYNPLQSARWFSLAARKGHPLAQARLGDMLFNGDGIDPQPVEGLMWLTIAQQRTQGTPDEGWITELLNKDMSVATPAQRESAVKAADQLAPMFAGL